MRSSVSVFTTPNADGSFTFCTQITASLEVSRVKLAIKRVSANATTVFPLSDSDAQCIACAVPNASF